MNFFCYAHDTNKFHSWRQSVDANGGYRRKLPLPLLTLFPTSLERVLPFKWSSMQWSKLSAAESDNTAALLNPLAQISRAISWWAKARLATLKLSFDQLPPAHRDRPPRVGGV